LSLTYLAEITGDRTALESRLDDGLAIEGIAPSQSALLHANLGIARAYRGDLTAALSHNLAAQRFAERVGPGFQARIGYTMAYVHIWRGELAAARGLLSVHAADELIKALDHRGYEVWGLLLEEEGEPVEALAHFQSGSALEDDPISMWCAAGAARVASQLNDLSSARMSLERLEGLLTRWPSGRWLRDASAGWLAAGEQRVDEAVALLRAAAGASPEAFHAARLACESARLARDREGMSAAIDAFERMGAVRAADRARAGARELGMRPRRARKPAGMLTLREQEVVQLVAAGRTNAEIAEALYVSQRTAEHHVSNILTKLGYRSRVQIASEAAAGRLPGISRSPAEPPGI
jgi:DNA-binding CsgD family transcriptional regulator